MQIIVATLCLVVLMWSEAASAQTRTYSVSVSRHTDTPPLSPEDVTTILDKASKMLQKGPDHVDAEDNVACDVAFTLKGPVGTFGSPDTPASVDMPNLDAVHRVDANVIGADFGVKVVNEIKNFCRFPNKLGFHGCSFPPNFRSIIVVHPEKHVDAKKQRIFPFPDHILWAHEFGHLTGLGHREHKPDQRPLMTTCPLNEAFSSVPDSRVLVSRQECSCLRSGPGFGPNGTCGLPGPVPCSPLK